MPAERDASAGSRRLRPPGFGLLLAEARSPFELGASLLLSPLLLRAPKGDGHPVLVLPGFLASDLSTLLLRRFLKRQGYDVHGWGLGWNTGGVYRMRAQLREMVNKLYETSGRKISLVGWSLGGVYARDLALHMPQMIRRVITMGSPFSGDLTATNGRRLYEVLSGEALGDVPPADFAALSGELPVPMTSIYSKADGVVSWQTSQLRPSATAENIEVYLASHVGLGVNAAVLWAVADRLALPEGEFQPFDRRGPFAIAYAPPETANS